jgi:hypothetical protein
MHSDRDFGEACSGKILSPNLRRRAELENTICASLNERSILSSSHCKGSEHKVAVVALFSRSLPRARTIIAGSINA